MFARRFLHVLLSLLVGLIALAAIGAALNPVARAATLTVDVPAPRARSIPAMVVPASTCITIQRGISGSVADAYIWAAAPNENNNYDALYTGFVSPGEKQSLLRFDLSMIPAGSAVDSANLYVYLTSSSNQTVQAHAITATWSETDVTWSNFGNRFAPEITGTFVSNGTGFRSITVTTLVQTWLSDPPKNYGLLLEEALTGYTTYKSSEYGDSAYRPRLEICYHAISPRPTPIRLYPDVSSPCDTTLQACIDGSDAGDVIQIKAGTYPAGVTLNKPVSLIGLGVITPTTLIAPLDQRALTVTGAAITASTVISNLHFTSDWTPVCWGGWLTMTLPGTAISNPHMTDVACTGETPGGAILLTDTARPALNRLTIDNNSAYQGGGLWVDAGPEVVIVDSKITSNTAQHAGGGLYSKSDVRLINTLLAHNQSGDNGGGAYISSSADLNLARFENNTAMGSGGGLSVSGPVTLTHSSLLNNLADMGSGGGLYAGGSLLIKDSRLGNNVSRSSSGGGAYAFGPAKVADTILVSNSAALRGGGLAVLQAVEVQRSEFLRNTGLQSGGGLAVLQGAAASRSEFFPTLDLHTGLEVAGTLAVTNSIFISNTSAQGSGVYHNANANGRVVNSLFAHNTVSATGGVLYFASPGQVDVIHTTIADPSQITSTVNPAAAIKNEAGRLNVTDTLIADHAMGIYNTGAGTAQEDYNLFFRVTVITNNVTSGGHNQYPAVSQFVDPALGNYHLRSDAAAIDAGAPAGVAFDIDNQSRPFGPGFDIGFDEYVFSIQAEIEKTPLYGTVNIPPGVYTESLTLYKPVNLIGAGAAQTIIHAAAADRVLTVTGAAITSTTVISGLTFSNGQPAAIVPSRVFSAEQPAAMGGGLLITGLAAPTLIGVHVRDNRAVMGGGLYIDTGGATLIDSQVISNTADQSGGGAYVAQPGAFLNVSGSLIISNTAVDGAGVFVQSGQFRATGFSYLIGNRASHWGGGVLIGATGGQARIEASRLAFNAADVAGGGVLVDTGRFELVSGAILSNTADSGGGAYLLQPEAVFTQTGGTVDGNTADSGGGYYLNAGRVNLRGGAVSNNGANNGAGVYVDAGEIGLHDTALITGNIARDYGGGVYLSSPGATLTQWGGSIEANRAANGGGVKITDGQYTQWGGRVFHNTANSSAANRASVMTNLGGGVLLFSGGARFTQYGGSIAENTADYGGGLFVQAGRATLVDGRILSNTADLNGGGVYVKAGGQAVFVGGRIENNTTPGYGGGLYAGSDLVISATRFLNNAAQDGYAIYHTGTAAGRIVNALIADNRSSVVGAAGASVALNSTGRTQLVFSTLANSAAPSGRAIAVNGGGLSLVNSIVASYTVGLSQTVGPVSEDYNLFFGNGLSLTGVITWGVHTRDGLDPRFVAPAVGDYHIRQTSPAINRALDVGVTRDFDLDARPIGGGFDIGADETQGAGATIPPGGNVTTTLIYTSTNGGGTSVLIPPGAVSGTVTDTVSFYYTVISTDSITTPLPSRLTLSGDPFELDAFIGNEITATRIITFNAPVMITIHYTETDLNGISEQTLKLYRLEYPPFGTSWCVIGVCRTAESQTLDTVNNIITATVTGFSKFGTMGGQSDSDLFLPIVVKNG
jgi:hypothetical protein